ncbi:hypothetical protein D1007_51059 [Hordeum vulgare]|nr:hypothetical protein D1007_51059 [Hordeum vulgare]
MKGAMSVDILRMAMNRADSGHARQWAKWAKYREYLHPHDHRATVYFTTRIVGLLEEEQETVPMEVEEEGAMAMDVRALEPGHRSMPIELDSGEEEETMVELEE